MDNCVIEDFGLELFVDKHDCDNCPLKERSECKKALSKALKEANDNYLNYLQTMNRKTRRNLSSKEKGTIYNIYKREAIKKFLSEKGITLKYAPKRSSRSTNNITEEEYKQKIADRSCIKDVRNNYVESIVNICRSCINSYLPQNQCTLHLPIIGYVVKEIISDAELKLRVYYPFLDFDISNYTFLEVGYNSGGTRIVVDWKLKCTNPPRLKEVIK